MAGAIKTPEEIEIMRQGGRILAQIMEEIKKKVKPGVTTLELNQIGDQLIEAAGGQPSFKMVKGYQWATCMCVNETVVHGIPDSYQLKEGDLLGIDIGNFYQGFHTDMSETVVVSHFNDVYHHSKNLNDLNHLRKFITVGQEALNKAISMAKAGNHVGHISLAIQKTIEEAGFSPVKALVGHGVGKNLHEDPPIPCLLRGNIEETPVLETGMTLAIEVIYNQRASGVVYKNDDGWTIKTADNSLSGLFEKTIALLADGPEELTKTV